MSKYPEVKLQRALAVYRFVYGREPANADELGYIRNTFQAILEADSYDEARNFLEASGMVPCGRATVKLVKDMLRMNTQIVRCEQCHGKGWVLVEKKAARSVALLRAGLTGSEP